MKWWRGCVNKKFGSFFLHKVKWYPSFLFDGVYFHGGKCRATVFRVECIMSFREVPIVSPHYVSLVSFPPSFRVGLQNLDSLPFPINVFYSVVM